GTNEGLRIDDRRSRVDRPVRLQRKTLNLPSSIFNPRFVQVIRQGISERAGFYAHSWMDQHARRFDDHDQVLIFANNFERDRLWGHCRWSAIVERNFNRITRKNTIARAAHFPIHPTSPTLDEISDSHTTEASEARREEFVQPL